MLVQPKLRQHKKMNSTCPLPFCGAELIGTAELHDFNKGVYLFTEDVGSATSEVSDSALGLGIYSNSDRISPSMGSQRHTQFRIVPKGRDLYRVMKLSPRVRYVEKNLPATTSVIVLNKERRFYLQE